jgi:hypothetical protein
MATYNAAQIVGKTLYALSDVNITREPRDGEKTVFTVKRGQAIGIVDSYLLPSTGRTYLWWQFYDSKRRPYYVEHKTGLFDVKQIAAEGGKTTEEIIKESADDNKSGREFWSEKAQLVVITLGFIYLFKDSVTGIITGKAR